MKYKNQNLYSPFDIGSKPCPIRMLFAPLTVLSCSISIQIPYKRPWKSFRSCRYTGGAMPPVRPIVTARIHQTQFVFNPECSLEIRHEDLNGNKSVGFVGFGIAPLW